MREEAAMCVRIFALIVSGTLLFGLGRAAWAQGRPRAGDVLRKKHEPAPVRKKAKKDKGFRREGDYFVLEDIKIEGKIYKPEAFHVINRKELNLQWDLGDPRFAGSLLSKVLDSVKEEAVF